MKKSRLKFKTAILKTDPDLDEDSVRILLSDETYIDIPVAELTDVLSVLAKMRSIKKEQADPAKRKELSGQDEIDPDRPRPEIPPPITLESIPEPIVFGVKDANEMRKFIVDILNKDFNVKTGNLVFDMQHNRNLTFHDLDMLDDLNNNLDVKAFVKL